VSIVEQDTAFSSGAHEFFVRFMVRIPKGVIRSRISKDKQYDDQMKKDKQ
jgi:hypothetical protein